MWMIENSDRNCLDLQCKCVNAAFFVALILRGLDALTSEISLKAALSRVTMLPLKNLHVIRDENG